MMAVIFEVWPAEGRREDYLRLAAELRTHLSTFDGFISVERFESLYEQGKLLSLQFWRDEPSIAAWRTDLAHRRVQAAGRSHLFRDYRLRVAEVVRDYGMRNRTQAPNDLETAAL
jgi:heme-degrading monooxygenase HmoA